MSRARGLRAGLAAALAAGALAVAAPASADTLTTTFDGGNGFSGNSFDLEVRPASGITVNSLDVHLSEAGESAKVEVWTRPGTAVGNESSPDGWTLRGSATVTSAGESNPTPAPISFALPQGSYGVVIGTPEDTELLEYTDGAEVFEDAALKLTSGAGLEAPFFTFASDVIEERIWNGSIHYELTGPPQPPITPPVTPPATLPLGPPVAAPCDSSAAKAKLKRKRAKLKSAQGTMAKAKAFDGARKARKAKIAGAKRQVRSARGGVKAARRALAKAC